MFIRKRPQRSFVWDTNLTFFHLQLVKENQDLPETFDEALKQYKPGRKNLPSGSCCYGNRKSFFVFFQ